MTDMFKSFGYIVLWALMVPLVIALVVIETTGLIWLFRWAFGG